MSIPLPLHDAISCWHADTLYFDGITAMLEVHRTGCIQPRIKEGPKNLPLYGSYYQGNFRISGDGSKRQQQSRRPPRIVVEVPFTKRLAIGDIRGGKRVVITGSQALHLQMLGANDVHVSCAQTLTADVAGTGSLTVNEVTGYLKCTTRGAGNCTIGKAGRDVIAINSGSGIILVHSGDSTLVELRSLGTGEVRHMGQAVGRALVKADGNGRAWLETCRSDCTVRSSQRGNAGVGTAHGTVVLEGKGTFPATVNKAFGVVRETGNTQVIERV
ncbi:MAG TPA: hypothetical protein VFZ48_04615 [Candidatus Saccharimonadales bacterium]